MKRLVILCVTSIIGFLLTRRSNIIRAELTEFGFLLPLDRIKRNGAVCLTVGVMVTGCGIGGFWMEGNPFHNESKPYGAHWVKEGMTKESRLDDIAACGSARTEYVGFSKEKIKAEKRPEDPNDIAAYLRLRAVWAECMESKGYRYEQ